MRSTRAAALLVAALSAALLLAALSVAGADRRVGPPAPERLNASSENRPIPSAEAASVASIFALTMVTAIGLLWVARSLGR